MVAASSPALATEPLGDFRRAQLPSKKSCTVVRSESSPLSVLDFLVPESPVPTPGCSTPLTSPKAPVADGSPSPNLPQSPLLASQRLFARLSSTNFQTPGRGASSSIPPRASQNVRAPSPHRLKGTRARVRSRSFGRSSSLNENKVCQGTVILLFSAPSHQNVSDVLRWCRYFSNTASSYSQLGMPRPLPL